MASGCDTTIEHMDRFEHNMAMDIDRLYCNHHNIGYDNDVDVCSDGDGDDVFRAVYNDDVYGHRSMTNHDEDYNDGDDVLPQPFHLIYRVVMID